MRKRRMPDEKIAELVSRVAFGTVDPVWMEQLENCFHQVLTYEYYLKQVPDNLAHPKYRKLMIRIIYRLLNQVHPSRLNFSKNPEKPDPMIGEFLEYLIDAEIRRKQEMLRANPVTPQKIRSALFQLKREHEI